MLKKRIFTYDSMLILLDLAIYLFFITFPIWESWIENIHHTTLKDIEPMKYLFIILCSIGILLTGCDRKSLYELQKESLESGMINDSIVNGLCFGMSESQVFDILGWRVPSIESSIGIKGLKECRFSTYPAFFNDSLYAISYYTQNLPENLDVSYKEIIKILEKSYGEYSFRESDSYLKKIVWLKGNLQIQLMCFSSGIGNPDGCDIFVIRYSDLSRNEDFMDFSQNELIRESKYSLDDLLTYYPDEDIATKSYQQTREKQPVADTIAKLEQKSLASGKQYGNILENVTFGMNIQEVLKALNVRSDSYYKFDLDGLKRCKFVVTPYSFNDNIIGLVFFAYGGGDLGEHINNSYLVNTNSAIAAFTSKYGKPTYISTEQAVWLDGNLKIEIKGGSFYNSNTLRIEFKDLSQKITDLDIISGRIIKYDNQYETLQYQKDTMPKEV